MKKIILKLSSYFLNSTKKYSKLELFSNWLIIILPIALFTILMIWDANSRGKTDQQLRKELSSGIIGLAELVWIALFVWLIIYKLYRFLKRKSNRTQKKENKKMWFRKKEDWEE